MISLSACKIGKNADKLKRSPPIVHTTMIDTILHHINLMVQCDWSCEPSDSFNCQNSISKLSELSAISKRNLHIVFKSYTGEYLHKYINRLRLEYAWGMLKSGNYTNEKIAEHIGFANVTAFYNAFKKHFGQTPAQSKQAPLPLRTTPSVPKHRSNSFIKTTLS